MRSPSECGKKKLRRRQRHYDVTGLPWRDIGKKVVKTAKVVHFGHRTPHFSCSWAEKLDFWHCRGLKSREHCFYKEKPVKCLNFRKIEISADFSNFLIPHTTNYPHSWYQKPFNWKAIPKQYSGTLSSLMWVSDSGGIMALFSPNLTLQNCGPGGPPSISWPDMSPPPP